MEHKDNATYQLILDAADKLFSERGYTAITLQDIARAVKMRHASLYYYAPNGKEQLYVEVMERNFKLHSEGLTNVIIEAGDDFHAQIHAVAHWFATHPPLDLGRIVRSDMPAINKADAERLLELSIQSLRVPIAAILRNAVRKGLITLPDIEFAAMGLVGLLQSVHNIPRRYLPAQEDLVQAARSSADMLLFGWFNR